MTDDTTDPQAVTSGTVADIKDHIAQIDDADTLAQLRDAEADGKARPTALAAIDAKAEELNADGTDGDKIEANGEAAENVTKPPVIDGVEDIDQPATVLVQAPQPEKLTDADINDATGDGLKDDASQQQADAAQGLVEARDDAKGEDVPDHTKHPLYGYGPGADIG